LLGLVFFQVLQSGLVLSAKNTAINAAHEETRNGLNRLTRDIHASVSVPQLRALKSTVVLSTTPGVATQIRATDVEVVNSKPVNGVPPTAAGVSFQNIYSGPHNIFKDPATPTLIQIAAGPPLLNGLRLIVPYWGAEDDLYKFQPDQSSNAFTNVFLVSGIEAQIVPPGRNSGKVAVCYYTDRVMYLVQNGTYVPDAQGPWVASGTGYVAYSGSGSAQRFRYDNGELHLYKQRWVGDATSGELRWIDQTPDGGVAKFISSPKPFYVPLTATGAVNTRYVGVKLSARDPQSTNQNYRSSASLLETEIDYRSRITLKP
jgi:hypothetical protein